MTTYEAMSIMIMLLMLILEIIDNKSQKNNPPSPKGKRIIIQKPEAPA